MATNNKPEKQKRSKVSNPKVTKNPGPLYTLAIRREQADKTIKNAVAFGNSEYYRFGYTDKVLRVSHKVAATLRYHDLHPAFLYKSAGKEDPKAEVVWVDSFEVMINKSVAKLLMQKPVHTSI